jgi:hypothetical protein
MTYRKIGGIWFFAFGRFRVSFCKTRRPIASYTRKPLFILRAPVDLAALAARFDRRAVELLYNDRIPEAMQ